MSCRERADMDLEKRAISARITKEIVTILVKRVIKSLITFRISVIRCLSHITQTRPCNIQEYFTAVKMLIFR